MYTCVVCVCVYACMCVCVCRRPPSKGARQVTVRNGVHPSKLLVMLVTSVHIFTCEYASEYVLTYVCAYMVYMCSLVSMCVRVYEYTCVCANAMYACVYACARLRACNVRMHVCVCAHVCVYVHVCSCLYVCTCLYVPTCVAKRTTRETTETTMVCV